MMVGIEHCAAYYKSGWWFGTNCAGHDPDRQPPYFGGNARRVEIKIHPKNCLA